jgi:hypothetical protein
MISHPRMPFAPLTAKEETMKFVLNSLLAAALAVTLGSTASLAASAKHHGQKKAGATHSYTGCLAKGDEANTWKLTDVKGKIKSVELVEAPASLDLNAHVGHTVTITGTSVKAKEAAKAEGEKTKGTTGKTEEVKESMESHIRPTHVKMVSESCK